MRCSPGTPGRWRYSPPPFAAFFGLIAFAFAALASSAPAAEYAKPVSNRLNTTGRAITIPFPIKSHGAALGDVTAQIDPDDNVSLSKTELAERLAGTLDAVTQQGLAAIPGDGGFVPLDSLVAAGINVTFDQGLQEIEFHLSADQHQDGDISLAGTNGPHVSANLTAPAGVSGYVNLRGGFDTLWANEHSGPAEETRISGRLEIESALRLTTLVFENRSIYEGEIDTNICPSNAICAYDHLDGLKRQGSRLVYDMPEDRIRMMIGDTDPVTTGFQRSTELLGVSLQKSDRKLAPGEAIMPSGSSSFRIERPSEVEIIVNGATLRLMRLHPGTYNVRDLPLVTGANEVTLRIKDEAGETRTMSFTTFSDQSLLAAGQTEWAVGAGTPSYLRDNERHYAQDLYLGHGYFRYGLSDELTGEALLHGDSEVIVAGAGIFARSPVGVFGLRAAGSWGLGDPGAALDASWDAVNFNGLVGNGGESFHLSAELRSSNFHTSGEDLDLETGIIYPEFNYWLGLNAAYSAHLTGDITATLAGRYRLDNEDHPVLSPYIIVGDRFGADLTLSRPLADAASASLTLGYSNESYLRGRFDGAEREGEFRIAMRVNMRPDESTSLTAGYDTLNRTGEISGYRHSGSGVGSWNASVLAQHRDYEQSANAHAAVDYLGNRGEVRVSHYANVDGLSYSEVSPEPGTQRTSVRVGTAIAFANSKIAIGAPVRGDAFAIVYPHPTIADKVVTIGEGETVRAIADDLGPALVPDVPAYRASTVPVDVADLPLGYSLGASAFDTYAPYRGGYAMEVGSSFSASLYGTLLDPSGAPLALLSGTAYPENNPGRRVTVFTNAAGRFGAEGLGGGRWIIEMPAVEGVLRYVVDVPENSEGLVKVGELLPSQS